LAAEQRADAGGELLEAEGLGQVVVGSSLQSGNAVAHLLLGGKHQDGNVSGGFTLAQAAADFDAVHAWQEHVEDDKVRAQTLGLVEAADAVGGVLDMEALVTHAKADKVHDALLVIYNQEPGPCIVTCVGLLLTVLAAGWRRALVHNHPFS